MASQLVLFVHGLGGHQVDTWGSFPGLIRADPELSSAWVVDFFSFPSSRIRVRFLASAPRVQLLADGLRTELETKHPEAERIVLVCHSLGGLVARRYLLDEYRRGVDSRVTDLLLYGTPNTGAGLANVARHLSWFQPQLRQLSRNSEFLSDLNRDWNALGAANRLRVLAVIGGKDDVVPEESARGLWRDGNVKVVLGASHADLVKPSDSEDVRYLILKRALLTAPLLTGTASASDYKEALPQLVRVVREANATGLELNADKRKAILVVWKAVEKTQLHLQEIKEGRKRPDQRNPELIDLWSDAALAMSAFDGQLARRLRQKAEYWNVPTNWTESECQHAGIMMDAIEESSRTLL
jgi:pimeloyl-ACP methyl ester carboxylesterase